MPNKLSGLRTISLALAMFGTAACSAPQEQEPAPPPTVNPVFTIAAIAACRDAAGDLKLPPQAAGDCVAALTSYTAGNAWPGTETLPAVPGVSRGFQAALDVTQGWERKGYVRPEDGNTALVTLMRRMAQQRQNLPSGK